MPTDRYYDELAAWMQANPCPADQFTPAALIRGHETRDEGMRRLVWLVQERHAQLDAVDADLRAARKAREEARSIIDGAGQVLDRVGVQSGLLADRILALAVERESAREERNRAVLAQRRAEKVAEGAEGARFLALVMGVAFAAALVAGLLAALGFLPTLSVA